MIVSTLTFLSLVSRLQIVRNVRTPHAYRGSPVCGIDRKSRDAFVIYYLINFHRILYCIQNNCNDNDYLYLAAHRHLQVKFAVPELR